MQRDERIQAYLYASEDEKRNAFDALPEVDDDPIPLVRQCLQTNRQHRQPGAVLEDRFELPHLRTKYPDELLSFLAPDAYDPSRPTGLVILLHGGGSGTPRDAAKRWLLTSDEPAGYHFGAELALHPFVAVAPSNLLLPTHQRWSNPDSDAYVLAVVEEASFRYNIDPNRVTIVGQSMGGFGAYHIVQTIGDRFATVGCHAGAWYYGFWRGLSGVDFYNMHGATDAAPGVRPRFTDVPFARFAHAILSGYHLPHTYIEHEGGHSFSDPRAREACLGFLDYIRDQKRDAVPQHVVTASRKGAFDLYDSPDFFWISIDETHFGSFELDHIEPTEGQPSYCTTHFRHRVTRCRGGTVDAENCGENLLRLRTHNVDALTIWLNPDMVDYDRPVCVEVNGKTVHEGKVIPSLATTLQSFDRRRDPGMLFSAKISLKLKVDDWAAIR